MCTIHGIRMDLLTKKGYDLDDAKVQKLNMELRDIAEELFEINRMEEERVCAGLAALQEELYPEEELLLESEDELP